MKLGKILLRMFRKPIKNLIIRELEKDTYKDLIVTTVNQKLDIPNLTESEESNLFAGIYDASLEALVTALERIGDKKWEENVNG